MLYTEMQSLSHGMADRRHENTECENLRACLWLYIICMQCKGYQHILERKKHKQNMMHINDKQRNLCSMRLKKVRHLDI